MAEAVETEPNPSTPQLAQLREGILKTLEVFNATNQRAIELSSGKEKEGDKGEGKGKQRDAGLGTEEEVKEHYFFPKYLTKRNLLDLEVSLSIISHPSLTSADSLEVESRSRTRTFAARS